MPSPGLESRFGTCPYCGETVEFVVDASAGDQDYIEDCFVCCRPIQVTVRVADDGSADLVLRHEDDA